MNGARRPSGAGRARRVAGFALSAVTLAYLLIAVARPAELVARFAGFRPAWLAPIALGIFVFHLLGAASLWVLVPGVQRIRFAAFAAAYWRTLAVGQWMPSGISDASLVWFLGSHGLAAAAIVAMLVVDKAITLMVLGVVAVAAVELASDPLSAMRTPAMPATALLVLAAAVLIFLVVPAFLRYRRWLAGFFHRAAGALAALVRRPSALLGNLLLTLVKVVAAGVVLWLCAESLEPVGVAADFVHFVALGAAARLLALVLPTPNGLGVYELSLVVLLEGRPFAAATLVSAALLVRVVSLSLISLGLLVTVGGERLAPPNEP